MSCYSITVEKIEPAIDVSKRAYTFTIIERKVNISVSCIPPEPTLVGIGYWEIGSTFIIQ